MSSTSRGVSCKQQGRTLAPLPRDRICWTDLQGLTESTASLENRTREKHMHTCMPTNIRTYKHTHIRTYMQTAQAAEQGQGPVAGSQKAGGCCWLWDRVPPLPSLSSRLCAHLPPQIQGRAPVSNEPSARGSCPPAARERGEAGIGRSPSNGKWTFFADASPLNSAQTQLPLTPSKDPGKQDSANSLGRYSTCSLLQKVSRDTREVWATGAALWELRH